MQTKIKATQLTHKQVVTRRVRNPACQEAHLEEGAI